jgi:hypothetical protein
VRAQAERILLGARDLPPLGDQLGRDALRHELVALHQRGRERRAELVRVGDVRAHRHAAHVLDAGADHHLVDAGGNQADRERHGLLA